jgi:hypothetical protein
MKILTETFHLIPLVKKGLLADLVLKLRLQVSSH